MGNVASNQGLIIGLTVGAVVLLIIIIITVVCCCCRKAERSILKRGVRRLERQTEEQKNQLKIQQSERRTELNKKHDEIREKYGLRNSAAATSNVNPNDNIFSVENDKVTLSIK